MSVLVFIQSEDSSASLWQPWSKY